MLDWTKVVIYIEQMQKNKTSSSYFINHIIFYFAAKEKGDSGTNVLQMSISVVLWCQLWNLWTKKCRNYLQSYLNRSFSHILPLIGLDQSKKCRFVYLISDKDFSFIFYFCQQIRYQRQCTWPQSIRQTVYRHALFIPSVKYDAFQTPMT